VSFSVLGDVNWLAIVVGAVIYFALGALWYSPMLLGRPWQRSIGWDPNQTPPQMNPASYVIPLLAFLVTAVATAMLAVATGTDELGEGIVLGLVMGIGLATARTVVDATFDPNLPQPATWFAITAGYHTLGVLIVGVLVAIWR